MKIKRAVLGVAISIIVLDSQLLPILADSFTSASGTGHVLNYTVETVVVPTSFKIALNPNKYEITTKYVKAVAFTKDEIYYTYNEDTGEYVKAATPPTNVNFADDEYYTALTSDEQVVSLNYGIANKSTEDKIVKVDFTATYENNDNQVSVEFVDNTEKTEAYDKMTNPDGSKNDDFKIYLAVASAEERPTANTFIKAESFASDITYYTKDSDGSFTKAISQPTADNFSDTTYYMETTTIGVEITGEQLSDINMIRSTSGMQTFITGTMNKADASISYKLDKARYSLKSGAIIDFSTTQEELGEKFEITELGGVAGFTFIGSINTNADWSKAGTDKIFITPTYTIENVDDTEMTVNDDNIHN